MYTKTGLKPFFYNSCIIFYYSTPLQATAMHTIGLERIAVIAGNICSVIAR